jgi:hypothetical protein
MHKLLINFILHSHTYIFGMLVEEQMLFLCDFVLLCVTDR